LEAVVMVVGTRESILRELASSVQSYIPHQSCQISSLGSRGRDMAWRVFHNGRRKEGRLRRSSSSKLGLFL